MSYFEQDNLKHKYRIKQIQSLIICMYLPFEFESYFDLLGSTEIAGLNFVSSFCYFQQYKEDVVPKNYF